jgi:predicted RNA-binding protein YlqC (UPF0109 family)
VDIRALEKDENLVLEIRVAPEDVGKVVGKKGNVIRSMRVLAMSIGARIGRRVRLEVVQ